MTLQCVVFSMNILDTVPLVVAVLQLFQQLQVLQLFQCVSPNARMNLIKQFITACMQTIPKWTTFNFMMAAWHQYSVHQSHAMRLCVILFPAVNQPHYNVQQILEY